MTQKAYSEVDVLDLGDAKVRIQFPDGSVKSLPRATFDREYVTEGMIAQLAEKVNSLNLAPQINVVLAVDSPASTSEPVPAEPGAPAPGELEPAPPSDPDLS